MHHVTITALCILYWISSRAIAFISHAIIFGEPWPADRNNYVPRATVWVPFLGEVVVICSIAAQLIEYVFISDQPLRFNPIAKVEDVIIRYRNRPPPEAGTLTIVQEE